MIQNEKDFLTEQLQQLEVLLEDMDVVYSRLTIILRKMSPILKHKFFNEEDRLTLTTFIQAFREYLIHFDTTLRRGQGERTFLQDELVRQQALETENPLFQIVEAELTRLSENLTIRERCLGHLSELTQLLESLVKQGEMTEFDEKLLTEIVSDLKHLAE